MNTGSGGIDKDRLKSWGKQSMREEYSALQKEVQATYLREFLQYLYKNGYVDDDCFLEQPDPVHEFLNQ